MTWGGDAPIMKMKHMSNCSYMKMNVPVFLERTTPMKSYKIYVDCANCAAKMEEAVKKTDGIKDATVNFMALKMNVEFEEGADEKKVMKKALKAARKVDDDIEIEF